MTVQSRQAFSRYVIRKRGDRWIVFHEFRGGRTVWRADHPSWAMAVDCIARPPSPSSCRYAGGKS